MSKMRFRRKPHVKKFDSLTVADEQQKVMSELMEFASAYADCCRKAERGELDRADFTHLLDEAFDVSQSAQQFIHIAVLRHGKHYALTEDEVYNNGLEKNARRGYYGDRGYIKYQYKEF